jgi:hypothetical protein
MEPLPASGPPTGGPCPSVLRRPLALTFCSRTISDLDAAMIVPTVRRLSLLTFEVAHVCGCLLKPAVGAALLQERDATPCRAPVHPKP